MAFVLDFGAIQAGQNALANQYANIGQNLGLGLTRFQQLRERESQEVAAEQARQEGLDALSSRDPEAIAQFMAKYPGMSEQIKEAYQFQSQAEKVEAIRENQEFLTTLDTQGPEAAENWLQDKIREQMNAGEDIEFLRKMANTLRVDPDVVKKTAELNLASLMGPEAYLQQRKEEKTKFAQGTGVMAGYAFNPDTGEFTINQELKAELQRKAENKAMEKKKLGAKDRQSINKDVTGLTKDPIATHKAASALAKLRETSSPTDQLAAIFSFMKSLDPTSVVREGEQQMAVSTGGPADAFVGFINQIRGEGRLPAPAFRNMVNTAKSLANSAVRSSREEVDRYLDTYEDTLPNNFKQKLRARIPAEFEEEVAPTITSGLLNRQINEKDIQDTLAANPGMTREQLLERLRAE